jgi:hypothetical protein
LISKGHTGSGFSGLKNYLISGIRADDRTQSRVDWLETRNLPTDDPHVAARLMRATADQSRRCQKPVYHMMISFPHGEVPDQDTMRLIVDRHLEALEMQDHQALVAAHNDTDHAHVHVMVNRVHPETQRAARLSWDYARREKCRRNLEKELGLEEVFAPHVDYKDREHGLNAPERPVRGFDAKKLVRNGA